jgi:crotonobetainyl-CoA:carnitine CoA-transferase CaiB-like acyl-CoA transferase
VFYDLVRSADILVENNRPGVAARLKIDYPTLRAINPRLVYASISGFGQTGPWAQRPGFDLIAQAMSGVMSGTGYPGLPPVKNSTPIADLGSGLLALYGILSAIIGREQSGEGQFIDASLFETALSLSIWETAEYWGTGRVPGPIGSANRMSAPYQAVRSADGYLVIGAANQKLWISLCEVIGRLDLVEDRRFLTNTERLQNREVLIEEIEKSLMQRSSEEWTGALLAAGVPAAPIYNYAQALQSEQARARHMVMEMEHPVEGAIKALGFPVKMSETPQEVRYPPPLLGQHTEAVLTELGYNSVKVQELRNKGAFGL